ncbi:MAG: hypothetical protein QM657_18260 [Lacrimispora sp.]|uniref:hypothetical protein n=1 Tax=Lacrimispora sp. TaxID=2719234 RepID=UPI0039E574A5
MDRELEKGETLEKAYLSIEEQFKETLNNEEISRIEDFELREIRHAHWAYRSKIFLDEQNISDQELCRLTDIDYAQEKRELEAYKRRKGL